jgi:hypothetical protein
MAAASDGTAESRRYRALVDSYGFGWVLGIADPIIARHMDGRRPAWKRTVDCAQELDDTFRQLDEDLPGNVKTGILPEYDPELFGEGKWGDMTIREMPLRIPLPRGLVDRKRRATDTGAIPRNWSRLASDGMVFSTRRKRPGGGTVLIDQSGSMGLDLDEVLALMAAYPAVTIATYAGQEWAGELRIIARNGKRAADADCFHPMGGNVIDGPALEWLEGMPGPRVWVSDGMVTGTADCYMDPALALEAFGTVARAGIIRADRLGDLLRGGD